VHFHDFPEGGEAFDLDVDLTGSGIGTLNASAFTKGRETIYSIDSLRFDFGQSAATPNRRHSFSSGIGLAVGCWQRRRRASVA